MGLPSDVPLLEDELERKVYEQLSDLMDDFIRKRIGKAGFSYALNKVYGSVSGLMKNNREFNDLIVQMQKEAGLEQ